MIVVEHTQGDTYEQKITFKAKENAINLENCVVKFSVRKKPEMPLILEKELEILDMSGECFLEVSADDMNLELGDYYFDIQITWDDGKILTPVKWKIKITYQITK